MNTLLEFMDNGHEILALCRDAQLAGVRTIKIVPASMTDEIETESRGRSNDFKLEKVYYCDDHYLCSDNTPLVNLTFYNKLTTHILNS
jgi:hypothetical protein